MSFSKRYNTYTIVQCRFSVNAYFLQKPPTQSAMMQCRLFENYDVFSWKSSLDTTTYQISEGSKLSTSFNS